MQVPGKRPLLAAWLVVDAKSLDFTINGMEVGLLVFFLAYAVWSLFVSGIKRWLHLGLAWSGLMWTRPDGFIYIGALTAGLFLFNDPSRSGLSRVEWLKIHVRAGLVCAAAYLPWLAFMWDYYGSPIPHSVLAKAMHVGKIPLFDAMVTALKLPFAAWLGGTPLDAVFAPSYFVMRWLAESKWWWWERIFCIARHWSLDAALPQVGRADLLIRRLDGGLLSCLQAILGSMPLVCAGPDLADSHHPGYCPVAGSCAPCLVHGL